MQDNRKPVVGLLVDTPNWAYDFNAQALVRHLSHLFDFRVYYVTQQPDLGQEPLDLLLVYFWGETWHQQWNFPPEKVIKNLASHRWETEERYGSLTAAQMHARYLADARTFTAFSARLTRQFADLCDITYCPSGTDFSVYNVNAYREGPVRFGWAGNIKDKTKGVYDILLPAQGDDFQIAVAGGGLDKTQMAQFYNSIDVLLVASEAEGEPLTLLEGMACGAFPVAVDVGIVPEMVRHGENGLIVRRTPAAFRAAMQWCRENPAFIRAAGYRTAQTMAGTRGWEHLSRHWEHVFRKALAKAA